MFKDGMLITTGPRERLHRGLYGVRTYVPKRCEVGYSLFTATGSGAMTAYLMDMKGLIVYEWPIRGGPLAELLPDGNVMVAVGISDGLEELRPDGSRAWIWEGKEDLRWAYHHDFYIINEDELLLLAAVREPLIPGVYRKGFEPEFMDSDVVLRINRKKKILWRFSFSEHIDELSSLSGLPLPIPFVWKEGDELSPWRPYLQDWTHTNTVEMLPPTPLGEKDSRFKAGNILVSFRSLDIIAIIDPEKDALVWAWGLGILDGQHHPTMLDNGNILVFDNGTVRGYSIVREINPVTGESVWEYMDKGGFFSPFRSGVQRLANGNTFVCESDAGRLFEVTPEKEVVWDFYSPFLGQAELYQGKHIYRATRYSASYVEPVLRSRKGQMSSQIVDAEGRQIESYYDMIKFYQSG